MVLIMLTLGCIGMQCIGLMRGLSMGNDSMDIWVMDRMRSSNKENEVDCIYTRSKYPCHYYIINVLAFQNKECNR